MRTIHGYVLAALGLLGGCGTGEAGLGSATAPLTMAAPVEEGIPRCERVNTLPAGYATFEELGDGWGILRLDGVPFCSGSFDAAISAGVRIAAPLQPASSDPMPADGEHPGEESSAGKGDSDPMPADGTRRRETSSSEPTHSDPMPAKGGG